MKKFLAMLLVLIMVVSMVACGNPDAPKATEDNGSNETTAPVPTGDPNETTAPVDDGKEDYVITVKDSNGKASVKGADYDNKIVDAAMVEALSKVPGKDQLRATLLMLLKEPATRLARVLSEKAKKEAKPVKENKEKGISCEGLPNRSICCHLFSLKYKKALHRSRHRAWC